MNTATEPHSDVSGLDILIILSAYKRTILSITFLFAVGSIVISLLVRKEYKASVTLIPPPRLSSFDTITGSGAGFGGLGIPIAGASEAQNDRYVGMLRSHSVEDAIVGRFGLMARYRKRSPEDARVTLDNSVTIKGDGDDGLIHLSVEDASPQWAAKLANGWAEEFQNLENKLAIESASRRRELFAQQLDLAKSSLTDAELRLKQTEQKTGAIQIDSQERSLIDEAVAVRAQIASTEAELQVMGTYATRENPEMIEAEERLEALQSQLAKMGGSKDLVSAGLILPRGQIPGAQLDYTRSVRDVQFREVILDALSRQVEAARLDEAREGALVQILDPAFAPERKIYPQRSFLVITSTAAGFLLGSLLALLRAAIQNAGQIPQIQGRIADLKNELRWRPRDAAEAKSPGSG